MSKLSNELFSRRKSSIPETDFLKTEKADLNVKLGLLEAFFSIRVWSLTSKSELYNVQIQVFVKIIKEIVLNKREFETI